MHEKEVGGVLFLTDDLRNTCCHRDSRNAGRTDKRIDLAAGDKAHKLTDHKAAKGGKCKCAKAENDDHNGFGCKERSGICRNADRNAEEDGNDVAEFILRGLGKTVGNTADIEQVTEHQEANKRRCVRKNESDDSGNGDRENDLLGLGYRTERFHLDLTLFFAGAELHDRRLDDRDERHIRVSGNGNCT